MLYVAQDGNYGMAPLVMIDLSPEDADALGEMTDGDRWEVAQAVSLGYSFATAVCLNRGHHDSGDNPVDEDTGSAECQDCGEQVNALPDLG